ncbi:MAG: (d)CMP kinase [Oligoflexia bacterium]|nr:(d)CMP kinase [Oligoflexia bacterium]
MVTQRKVIAVDGLAGSGKTSIAKAVAARLGFAHLNTGLLYRSVAWLILKYGINPEVEAGIGDLLRAHTIELRLDPQRGGRAIVDGHDVTDQLQKPEVSQATSQAAQFRTVREALHATQRNAFPGNNLVAEGRDMGTVIFPDAELKLFIEVNEQVRIERRLKQLGLSIPADEAGQARLKEQIRMEIIERDRRDESRSLSPTLAAADAVRIDNSLDPLEKVVGQICSIWGTRQASKF